tara:strand:- start:93 stop:494 length:402 start_codon:yes stop_codon:yes gene_type:complete
MFQSDKNNSGKMSSILGPELEIHGNVKVSGSLLIYGKIYGDIESKGAINTANGSFVKGNILAQEAAISGEVEGDINVTKKVVLGSKSYLKGNLTAGTLTIEEGAKFDGSCTMVSPGSRTENPKTKEPENTSAS